MIITVVQSFGKYYMSLNYTFSLNHLISGNEKKTIMEWGEAGSFKWQR